jgi:hypothetical protein
MQTPLTIENGFKVAFIPGVFVVKSVQPVQAKINR